VLMIDVPNKLEPRPISATIIQDHMNHVKYDILIDNIFMQ
jgi:hypothetical protein